ncbi:hypothetical protein GGR57DRAFT_484075 [Xylariaceae sp. FL1272]|nr:hypothetical protein GGR57DRAFT_484075 [Xylariaceae sp. FL1272]
MEWIDLSHAPLGTRETRAKVRSHVTKAYGPATKKPLAWRRRNLRQTPLFEDTKRNSYDASKTVPANAKLSRTPHRSETLASPRSFTQNNDSLARLSSSPPMPLSGIELLAAESGMHILDLSALTVMQCGWTACAILASGPNVLNGLVTLRQKSSYLYSIAQRYGSSPLLDTALRCVATRARRILFSHHHTIDSSEFRQYVTALQTLQIAVNSTDESQRPEMLGAINLLNLYEILDYAHCQQAGSLHTLGAARLIQARGPASFVSDFDIRLMLSSITAITHEHMKQNVTSFFEEMSWQQMLQSFVIDDGVVSSRSALSISLIRLMTRVPRLIKDIRLVFDTSNLFDYLELAQLRQRLRSFRCRLLHWYAEYASTILILAPTSTLDDIRMDLLASYYCLIISCSRMLSSITLNSLDLLEDEAIAYSHRLINLESLISSQNNLAAFYIDPKLIIAKATLKTTGLWRQSSDIPTDVIERTKFDTWMSMILM